VSFRGASRVSNEDSDALLENLLGELGGSDAAPAPAAPSLGGSASALGGAGSGSFGAAAAAAPPVIARPVARYVRMITWLSWAHTGMVMVMVKVKSAGPLCCVFQFHLPSYCCCPGLALV
jgi:hypothetical protein